MKFSPIFGNSQQGSNLSEDLVGKGVFAAWSVLDFFKSVHIDKKTESVAWGENLDLDPYVLREKVASQKSLKQN